MAQPFEIYVHGVRADHAELETIDRALRASLDAGERAQWKPEATLEILKQLESMSQHLERHFANEEAGGYMEEALALAPRFSSQAAQLLKQHAHLNQSFAQLLSAAQRVKDSPESWSCLTQQIVELLKKLEAHEAAENRIMQEAFNVDLELTE